MNYSKLLKRSLREKGSGLSRHVHKINDDLIAKIDKKKIIRKEKRINNILRKHGIHAPKIRKTKTGLFSSKGWMVMDYIPGEFVSNTNELKEIFLKILELGIIPIDGGDEGNIIKYKGRYYLIDYEFWIIGNMKNREFRGLIERYKENVRSGKFFREYDGLSARDMKGLIKNQERFRKKRAA
ncbi:MAG: hypothetical protein ACQEP1_02185 [Nanobdellota archaeon]